MSLPLIMKFFQRLYNRLRNGDQQAGKHPTADEVDPAQLVQERNQEPAQERAEDYHSVIGRVAAFYAHEIRNPLTTIIGFSQFLEQDQRIKSDPHITQYISLIKEEAIRMESLIQELLSLSKTHLNQDNLSLVDVNSSIQKIVSIYSMQTKNEKIQFITELADEVYITGNTIRFERVLINLVKNAIESINDEGTIEIKVTKEEQSVYISVIDDGPGFQCEQLEQVFYPFYTTKDAGTGLGLPICKAIVETLGGTISLENHPTKGAHVKMRFPLSRQVARKS